MKTSMTATACRVRTNTCCVVRSSDLELLVCKLCPGATATCASAESNSVGSPAGEGRYFSGTMQGATRSGQADVTDQRDGISL